MAKLYTVESLTSSIFNGIPVIDQNGERYVSFIDSKKKYDSQLKYNDVMYLDKQESPKTVERRWGMKQVLCINEALFFEGLFQNSKRSKAHKIIYTNLTNFKVIKGECHYLFTKEEYHHYVLLIISKGSIIELSDNSENKKIIDWKKLM